MHTATSESSKELGDIDHALRGRAVRSAALTFARHGGVQALRLLSNLILSRLLFAEAFGLMALLSVLLQALQMFSDIGIRPSIVRSSRGDDPAFLDTAWTVQVLRGFGQGLIAIALAVPFARFYDEPLLAQMVPVAALSAVILGFMSTKQYAQDRAMQLGRLVTMELIAQSIGILTMIAIAFVWRSVLALVLGAVVTAAARVTGSWLVLPGHNNRFRWEPQARAELFTFGRWVFISTLMAFTAQAADRMIFGKLVSTEVLGVYSIGKMIAAAPLDAVAQVSVGAVFPLYSRIAGSGRPLSSIFAQVRRPVLIAAGFALSGMAACGSALIEALYDPRYAEAGWVVRVIALGAWFGALWNVNMAALLALGQSKWMAAIAAVKTAAIVALMPVGAWLGGFRGAVIALVAAEALQCVISTLIVRRHGLGAGWQAAPLSARVLLAATCGHALPLALHLPPMAALIAGAAIVIAIWWPLGWPLLRRLRMRSIAA